MEVSLFMLMFVFAVVTFWMSTRIHDVDVSNTYQFMYTFLSMVAWVGVIYNSFNIEYVYVTDTIAIKSYVDYTYIGISLAFLIVTLLNIIILGIYGSWNMLFKQYNR